MVSRRVGLGILLVVLALAPGSAWALTDEEIFRDFRFNFTNPGARALGLGGAFIAAADDATAAQANPAALHYVYKKELFLEYRVVQHDTQVFEAEAEGGSLDPAMPSVLFLELQSVTAREDSAFPSFASFALPFNLAGKRATFAFSRQVVLDTEASLEDGGEKTGLRLSGSGFPTWINDGSLSCAPGEAGQFQRYSVCNTVIGEMDAELAHYNLGFSYSITRDFSLGVTATYATLDVQSEVTNLTEDPRGVIDTTVNPRVDPGTGFLDIQQRNTIDDSDAGVAYTIGVHWHPDLAFPSEISPLRFGLVYRKGADLEVEQVREELDSATGLFVPTTPAPVAVTLREPDRYGLGFSYETDHWVYALDVERVKYSDLLEGYESGVNFFTNDAQLEDLIPEYDFGTFEFTVDDATVVHGGIEYRFVAGSWNWAIRGGYYNAPDNRIRLENLDVTFDPGFVPDPMNPPPTPDQIEDVFKEAFSGGDDADHFTAGFSFTTPIDLQFQFAGDFSDDITEFVVSAIWRFGKGRS